MPSYTWPLVLPTPAPGPAVVAALNSPSSAPQVGPLSLVDLLALWVSVTDREYSRPIIEAGEGDGLEAITQALAQFERVSQAIDTTTQEMFILPWSGQTGEPAGGARKATATLAWTRTRDFGRAVTLVAGQVLVEEEINDFGPSGPVAVRTGRRYAIGQTTTLGPGEKGPIDLPIVAERSGRGYNNAAPGGITRFVQVGATFANDGASVVPGTTSHRLVTKNQPDVVIPDHVGQYIQLTGGANAGQVRRVVGYEPPVPEGPGETGGVAVLAATEVLRTSLLAGSFALGELVEQWPSGAQGRFVSQTPGATGVGYLVLEHVSGTFVAGQALAGDSSGAQAMIDSVDLPPTMAAETGTASWRMLDWATDLGLAVTNDEAPTGGRIAMLDELGNERDLGRAPNESDDAYRRRVSTPADVVTPNAVQRRANRVLGPLGGKACLREVGSSKLRGLFFDGDAGSVDPTVAFAFDLDTVPFMSLSAPVGTFIDGEPVEQVGPDGALATGKARLVFAATAVGSPIPAGTFNNIVGVRGTFVSGATVVGLWSGATQPAPIFSPGLQARDQWKVMLDYADFRAFFLVGIPPMVLGEYGVAFDVGLANAFDAFPAASFFDGAASTAAVYARQVWQEVNRARAGGVGFDLYVESGFCE